MVELVDVLIVGGGLTGLTLDLALRSLGYKTFLIERQMPVLKTEPDFDARNLALSPASMNILKMLGIWSSLESKTTPIKMIHTSLKGAFGATRLTSENHLPLGWVVEIHELYRALCSSIHGPSLYEPSQLLSFDCATATARIQSKSGEKTIQGRVVVAADGVDSSMRKFCGLSSDEMNYQEQALVTNIGLLRSHSNIAYERFTESGPLALLPLPEKRMAVIWALPVLELQRLIKTSDEVFLAELQRTFGYRVGRMLSVGKRMTYALRQVTMPQKVMGSVVFIGNAAHTLHPVAGQGFNLGLRDVAALVQCIQEFGLNQEMLLHYQKAREPDQALVAEYTHRLVSLFSKSSHNFKTLKGLGLLALDQSPLLKKNLIHYASGYGSNPPNWACGMNL